MYEGTIFALLKSPLVLLTFVNISAGSISLGFMDPTLSPHLTSQVLLKHTHSRNVCLVVAFALCLYSYSLLVIISQV